MSFKVTKVHFKYCINFKQFQKCINFYILIKEVSLSTLSNHLGCVFLEWSSKNCLIITFSVKTVWNISMCSEVSFSLRPGVGESVSQWYSVKNSACPDISKVIYFAATVSFSVRIRILWKYFCLITKISYFHPQHCL